MALIGTECLLNPIIGISLNQPFIVRYELLYFGLVLFDFLLICFFILLLFFKFSHHRSYWKVVLVQENPKKSVSKNGSNSPAKQRKSTVFLNWTFFSRALNARVSTKKSGSNTLATKYFIKIASSGAFIFSADVRTFIKQMKCYHISVIDRTYFRKTIFSISLNFT